MTKKQLPTAAIGLSEKALSALRQAASEPAEWRAAMEDPIGFLKERGIAIPDGDSLELYEATWDPEKLSFHVSELDGQQGGIPRWGYLPDPGLWPFQCPPGTRPVRTL